MHGGTLKHYYRIQVQGYAILIFLPQFRTNVSLSESVTCLVPAKSGIFEKPECYIMNVLKINCGLIRTVFITMGTKIYHQVSASTFTSVVM